MAYYKFTKAILNGEPIDVYNNGDMKRDFTYIDDIIDGIIKVMNKIPEPNANKYSLSFAPYNLFNIGNNNPVSLRDFISAISDACGVKVYENPLPMQPGDVPITYADIDSLTDFCGFYPKTSIRDGILKFVDWYRNS